MKHTILRTWRSQLFTGLLAASCCLPGLAIGNEALTVTLEDFESPAAITATSAVDPGNSSAAEQSSSIIEQAIESGSGKLKLTDSDGGTNGAVITIPGGIPAPGYYLFTADVKVDNATAPITSYGMGVKAGAPSSSKISDENAGYVMNLTGSNDAQLGYQTIGAAINVPSGGTFPQDVSIYFGSDISGNSYNAPAADGDFAATHRASGTPSWPAGSSNAVYIDDIKRIGPGNLGEERHLWISVGDAFTNLATLEDILVRAKANNFTAVDILARYRGDAYYVPNRTDATYPNPEPFGSRIGTTTVSPENDPLQYAIDRGHELGLKVFISFSAFVVSPNNTYPDFLPEDSVMWYQPTSGAARPMLSSEGEGLWADPGREDVREYTKNILMDIVTNYDIDGVVFDRVRYPGTRFGFNPQAIADMGFTTTPSPFNAAFRDARRDAITDFIQECYEEVTAKKPWIVMGATPIAYGSGMSDTYNNVFQHWPTWTARKTANRVVDFGCIDLMQPQFYRLMSSGAPATNKTLMEKAIFGDTAVDSNDFGLMPGAYTMLAPLMYHPTEGDAAMSQANAQNFTDARDLDLSGFGVFPAVRTLNDMNLIRDPGASSAGTDVLAGTPTPVDYLFKAGYDTIAPNAVTNFDATPQSRGSVVFTWDTPVPAADGETPEYYYIYKSTSQPIIENYANLVTKLPAKGNWHHEPVGEAGAYFYKIVPADDYNNRGPATEIGPITVDGIAPTPADIIVDDADATLAGAWVVSSSSADKYGPTYTFTYKGTGARTATFTANIPETGNWTVSEWHPQGTNRATDARHTIEFNGGSDSLTVDQRSNGGQWNPIGTYSFDAGNSYSVIIDDLFTGSVVMADAIKWSYAPTPTAIPDAPTNLVATAQSTSEIHLTWADNSTNEQGFEIERTICGGTTIIIPVPADTTSFTDTGLATDTEYKYVIRAWSTGTQSSDSNIAAARTFPHIPDDIIIDDENATLTGAWATGSASTDYSVGYRTGYASLDRTATFSFVPERDGVYEIYEWHVAGTNRGADVPHEIVHANGAFATVDVNQSLNGGQWNHIGQWLFDGGETQSVTITNKFTVGSVVMADAIKVVYKAEPPTTPAAPSSLDALVISHEEVGLTWIDNAVNETGYEVVRTKAGGTPEVVAALAADSVGYIDTGLEALTQYSYLVRAINTQGTSGDSNTVTVTTFSSTPPDQIIDNQEAELIGDWAFGSFSADKWATNYAFRSKGPDGANRAVFNFTTRDHGLYEIFEWHPAGANRAADAPHIITHQYGTETVIVDQQGDGGQWNSLGTFSFAEDGNYSVSITDQFLIGDSVMADGIKVVWVSEAPTEAPAAPTGLAASVDGSQVDLTWAAATEDITGIQVLRNGAVIATLAGSATSYTDSTAAEGVAYAYTVRAVNYGLESGDSNVVNVLFDLTPPVITAPANVSVLANGAGCIAENVDLGQPVASDNVGVASVTNDAPATFPVGDTLVTWTATDAAGNSASAVQTVTVASNPAAAPTSVSADALAWDQVEVTWADSSNESGYVVRYSKKQSGPYTVAGSVGADVTSLVVSGLMPNTRYYFVVEAANACGASDSGVVSERTPLFVAQIDDPVASDDWTTVTSAEAIGGSYRERARRSDSDPAVWTVDIPVAGLYWMEIYIPEAEQLSTQAEYTLKSGFMQYSGRFNQRQWKGGWAPLGLVLMMPGEATLSVAQPNNSSNTVAADAVQFYQLF